MSKEQQVISRENLKQEVKYIKFKRKQLKQEKEFIESSFNGGLDAEEMEFEAIVLKVKRVLNERLHHAYILYGDEDVILDDNVTSDGGSLMFNDMKIFHIEDEVHSFEILFENCVQNIIDNEPDEDIKPLYEGLKFYTT